MRLTTLKLDIYFNKITIKTMGKKDLLWNKVCPIQKNKKALELQINKYLWQKKNVQKNYAQKTWIVFRENVN